ncbi:MAG: YchF-related putative GTPase [Candidatus Marsarchaeota archaeon]|nr:YchF-related putative GTPase [Candidatus Marsarchaeota archaeon]
MLVGLVGAPNKGKSTIFSAMTTNEVAIADYPFTTINPNLGIAYATKKCVHGEFNVQCRARNSLCTNGIRMFPINMIDVAGLVEGAHEGKGMGNQFLNDLSAADAIIVVADASGRTDSNGNKGSGFDPIADVEIVKGEIVEWLAGILDKHMNMIARRDDGAEAIYEVLASFKVTKEQIEVASSKASLLLNKPVWSQNDTKHFSKELLKISKPYIVAANKYDIQDPQTQKNIDSLKSKFGNEIVIPCSGAIEFALRKAAKQELIDYVPGSRDFKWIKDDPSKERMEALKYMQNFVKTKGTNIQDLINSTVFGLLDNITVYPVEDENKYTDHFGNVLPDAILIKRGSTALQLAEKIHTNLAKGMLYAVDARTKKRLAKDYVLKDDDVIKIVSAAK